MTNNPMFCEDGKWFFWDETWTQKFGPFETEDRCKEMIILYAKKLNGEPTTP